MGGIIALAVFCGDQPARKGTQVGAGTIFRCNLVRTVALATITLALIPSGALAAAWRTEATPSNPEGQTGASFAGVSCPAASSCVAVGTGSPDGPVLAESWDGTAWAYQPVPESGANPGLNSVSCVSATFCVAVGNTDGSTGRGSIDMWNGSDWTGQPAASGGPAGVSCTSGVFCVAVGGSRAEFWDGQRWRSQTVPHLNRTARLDAVSCTAPTACTAVGTYSVSFPRPFGRSLPLVEHWNGQRWVGQHAPGGKMALSGLSDVSCVSRSFCVAVGNQNVTQGVDFSAPPFVEIFHAGHWAISTAGIQTWTSLYGVSCVTAASCTAVGRSVPGHEPNFLKVHPFIEGWNGSRWAVEPTPHVSRGSELQGVSCVLGIGCTAVGWDGEEGAGQPLVETAASTA